MTIAELIAKYPEEWFPASDIESFPDYAYDIQWNEDFTLFHPIESDWPEVDWDDQDRL
jgi:hypothetical protein